MNIKRVCRVAAFLLTLLILLLAITDVLTCNELVSRCTVESLEVEEKDSLDAVVIGASEVFSGYCPTQAYKEFGYTSFSFGMSGAGCKVYKVLLAETLRRQKNLQAVAFEINGFSHKDEYSDKEGKLRNVIDNLPWSTVRLQAIHEAVDKDSRMNFYFPIAAYHDKIFHMEEVKKHLRNRRYISKTGKSYFKGFSTYSYAYDMDSMKEEDEFHFTEQTRRYLTDLLDYCKEQGLEHVLFYRAPHGSVRKNDADLEKLKELVASYGYDFIDYNANMEEYGIDIHHDFYNRDHTNVYGMEKMTHLIGDYFVNECGITINHTEEQKANWQDCQDKVDEMLDECKADIANKQVKHYKESAFYVKPEAFKHPEKQLNIKKEHFK